MASNKSTSSYFPSSPSRRGTRSGPPIEVVELSRSRSSEDPDLSKNSIYRSPDNNEGDVDNDFDLEKYSSDVCGISCSASFGKEKSPSEDYRVLQMNEVVSEAATCDYIQDLQVKARLTKMNVLLLPAFQNGVPEFLEDFEKLKIERQRRREFNEFCKRDLIEAKAKTRSVDRYGSKSSPGRSRSSYFDRIHNVPKRKSADKDFRAAGDSKVSNLKSEQNYDYERERSIVKQRKTILDLLVMSIESKIRSGDKSFTKGPAQYRLDWNSRNADVNLDSLWNYNKYRHLPGYYSQNLQFNSGIKGKAESEEVFYSFHAKLLEPFRPKTPEFTTSKNSRQSS